ADVRLKVRFENEARAISALNHPHICALYDVGPDYLVMEYCEGKTLAQRITQGALPAEQVIEYGMQIADALEKAHRAGIIHRDLKPSNIMITKSGVKLLDFGLAEQRAESSPDESTAVQVTEDGKILGTIQYMAPELLHGNDADERSDIFALGLVLYEMAMGKPAFSGTSKAGLIAAILEREPPHVDSSATLDRLIQACLARDPDERIQSANDVKLQLRWVAEDGDAPAPSHISPRRRKATIAAFVCMMVITAMAVVAAAYLARRLATVEQPTRSGVMLPAGVTLDPLWFGPVALSPDSRKVAMIAGTALAVHDFGSGETKTLAGTEAAVYPFWSPDSEHLGFFAQGKLKSINANGGAVQIVCDAPEGRGGAWSPLGLIIFTPGAAQPIFKVSEGGGTPIAVTRPKKDWSHRNPSFLPDGKTFLYTARTAVAGGTLYAGSIEGNVEKRIMENASNAAFVDGRLLFVRNRNLVAQRFDLAKLAVSGMPIPIAEAVDYAMQRDLGNFSVTSRALVYVSAGTTPRQIVSFDPASGRKQPIGAPGEYEIQDVSCDGRKAALSIGDSGDVWIMQLDRGTLTRATFTNASWLSALFSPDGSRLAFSVKRDNTDVMIQSLDENAAERVLQSSSTIELLSWSADGQDIVVAVQRNDAGFDIDYLRIRDHKLMPLLNGLAVIDAALSPDDKWLAYTSDEAGTPQVYVTAIPAAGRKWQISSDSGTSPLWSHDGRQLFFVSRGKLNVVAMRGGSSPEFGTPSPLPVSVDQSSNVGGSFGYATAPRGRVILTQPAGEPRPRSIHLITNWTRMLP
ncbi:MAG TPA: protein kinase, partial [Thermoanaerobaculia bacterium]|nr:protein kinase [Thermoanaerobaculia bacterium]